MLLPKSSGGTIHQLFGILKSSDFSYGVCVDEGKKIADDLEII